MATTGSRGRWENYLANYDPAVMQIMRDKIDRVQALIGITDTDGDGITNGTDPDDDNDGVLDLNDAFPLDATEIIGSDLDGVGDNVDTDERPSPYNGVTPDSSLGLAFNNIGVFSASDSLIYACLRIFTDGLPGSVNGVSEFDIGLTVVSLDEATVQITQYREFNAIGALNENVELPDCSGKFETMTSVYTDIIEVGDSVLDTTWILIDSTNLILKLSSYKELTAN
jgi:hypothetical protein